MIRVPVGYPSHLVVRCVGNMSSNPSGSGGNGEEDGEPSPQQRKPANLKKYRPLKLNRMKPIMSDQQQKKECPEPNSYEGLLSFLRQVVARYSASTVAQRLALIERSTPSVASSITRNSSEGLPSSSNSEGETSPNAMAGLR